ncbi:MAG TPA: carboxylating nicotinate-nucleotide diphosphorylase [Gemmatimonadales bacterium]|nr:carboxylating nicotinate-nucleotide diphosphorylase [Gemmatimonadales bacterium]
MADPTRLGIEAVRLALAEDHAIDDVTTPLLGTAAQTLAAGRFVAEADCVVAGLPVAELVFRELDAEAVLRPIVTEGARARSGAVLATVNARAGTLLAGERVALNFLQRLTGIATMTRVLVDAVAGTKAQITHTRKTTPGLRELERYAVRMGGGADNRASLAESVMFKDNHWVMLGRGATGVGGGLRDVLARASKKLDIVVEAETDAQFDEALAAGVTHILADNRSPATIAAWVKRARSGVTIQASGGITAANVAEYAAAGAHLISVGALTHSAAAAAIGFELQG